MKKLISLVGGLGLLLVASNSAANAAVVGFNDFPETNSFYNPRGPVITESGFTVTSSSTSNNSWGQWSNGSRYNADPTGHTLFFNFSNLTATIASVTSASFDFNSIDLGDVYNGATGGSVGISWDLFGGGTGSTTVILDALVGLQTFTLNILGVTAVRVNPLTTYGRFLQLDNIVLNASVSTVPVPAALPLLATGIIGLGAAARRRNKRKAV